MNESAPSSQERSQEEAETSTGVVSMLLRLVIPIVLLALGGGGYAWFSKEPERERPPRPKRKPLEVQAKPLERVDYQIRVPTHGIMQAHSEVNLTAQVGGRVQTVGDAL